MTPHPSPNTHFWTRARTPLILQTEAAECGLACLAMIAGHWGYRVDLASMRRRFSISLKGATLRSLMSMARVLLLNTRPLKLDMAHMDRLSLPCVLHWDLTHFVVLVSLGKKNALIHDPAVGSRTLPLAELSKHFTGVALELSPSAQFKPAEERVRFTMLGLMGHVVGLKRGLAQLLLIGLAMQVCSLVAPFYLQWVVDEALVVRDRNLMTVLGIGFLLLVIIQSAMSAVRSWITTSLATSLNFQWLGNAFGHLMRLPLSYFEKRHLGDVVSRFGSIQTIQHGLTSQFVDGVIDGMLVIATLAMMFVYSAKLTAVPVFAILIYAGLRLALFKPMRDASAEQIIHAAKQQTHFMESARGAQSIRLFNRAEERRVGWLNALAEQFNADLRIAKLSVSYQTVNSTIFGVERVVVIWLAALEVLAGHFSVGMLFAYLSYKDQFSQRSSALIDKLFEFRMLRLHGERVADIVLTETEKDFDEVEVAVGKLSPSIELRDVSYRYADGEPDILKGLNLKIEAGQCVAIAGPSGCGKTTLLKIILGLIEPTEGEVRVGGEKLQRVGLRNLRESVGAVMQEDQLFAGSIADNICFFDSACDQNRIEASAALAAVHAEIAAMPMGYGTLVGDVGSGLSGGQKQRILLARALYRSPKILCLDEATSHLDVWNERLVNVAIEDLQMTRIIVAHRPETIAMAERVVVLERGQVVRDFDQPGEGRTCRVKQQAVSPHP